MTSDRGPRPGSTRCAICVALFAFTALTFWPALGHGFVNYDDDVYITANAAVQRGLTGRGLVWAWTTGHAANWHPLTWMSHMLDVQLFGLAAWGHHLTSVLWHAINASLLFLVLARMTGATWPSACVAALFAVHPLHVESVAWVAERKDVLSTFFWLLTLAAYHRYVDQRRLSTYLPVLGSLAAGLAAKPMLVTLPGVLLLLDYWPLGRWQPGAWRRLAAEKLPLAALCAVAASVTWTVQLAGGAVGSDAQYPLPQRLLNAATSCVVYLGRTVWPRDLAVFYPHPGPAVLGWTGWAALGSVVMVTAVALLARRRLPYLLTGWLWYLMTLIPVVGIVQVGEQAMADRYTYVPLIGPFIAIVWSAREWIGAWGRRGVVVGAATAASVLFALALNTRAQIGYWRDSETLFEHALEVTRDNATAHLNLALALSERGDSPGAIEHLEQAVRIRPGFAKAHNNLGVALERSGRPSEALGRYEQALRLDPDYVEARYNATVALALLGRAEEAVVELRRVIEQDPTLTKAYYNCGTLLARLERWDDAAWHLERSIELEPGHGEAHYNLGAVHYYRGDWEAAWKEMALARAHGYAPHEAMLELLRAKMPEPLEEASPSTPEDAP